MARSSFGELPKQNPCAQCGQPIAAPDWAEPAATRVAYVWYCEACDYRFEAIAFFDDREPGRRPVAA